MSRAIPAPGNRGVCQVCGRYGRATERGTPYPHKNLGESCPGSAMLTRERAAVLTWEPNTEEWAGPRDLVLRDGAGRALAYVSQEIERRHHDPTTDKPTGRWEWSDGATRGVLARKDAAMRHAERAVS